MRVGGVPEPCARAPDSKPTRQRSDIQCRISAVSLQPHPPVGGIVAKNWEPGNLVPSRFSGEIRKVEARLGKLAKIRKVETD